MSNTANNQAAPWITQAGNFWSNVGSGDPLKVNAAVGPQVALSRAAYDQAGQQVSRTVGKGGLRDATLGNLQTAQAGDVSRIFTGGISDAIQRLAGLGTGEQQASLSGLGTAQQAGNSLANLSAAKAQAVGQGIAGLGGAAGSILGGFASAPAAAKKAVSPYSNKWVSN